MSVDLHELEAFSAVARHRSFRKTAQDRGVSASALSHAMRSLESRLGLRRNVPRPAAQLFLGRLLADFVARCPKVGVEVVTDDGLTDIVAQGFDAGIRYDESLAVDMIAVPIDPLLDFAVVASPDYLARHGVPNHRGICRDMPVSAAVFLPASAGPGNSRTMAGPCGPPFPARWFSMMTVR